MEGMNPNPQQQLYPSTLITMYKWQSDPQCDYLWAEPVAYKALFKTEMQSNSFSYKPFVGGQRKYQLCENSSGKDKNTWKEEKGQKTAVSFPDLMWALICT